MSLIDMSQLIFRGRGEGSRPPQEPDHAPSPAERSDPTVVYLLTHEAPCDPAEGYRLGWTLSAHYEGPWCWSTSLAPRGAAPSAGAHVAQAVAVRVLTEQGIAVQGWSVDSDDDQSNPTRFRAVHSRSSSDEQRPDAGPATPRHAAGRTDLMR